MHHTYHGLYLHLIPEKISFDPDVLLKTLWSYFLHKKNYNVKLLCLWNPTHCLPDTINYFFSEFLWMSMSNHAPKKKLFMKMYFVDTNEEKEYEVNTILYLSILSIIMKSIEGSVFRRANANFSSFHCILYHLLLW